MKTLLFWLLASTLLVGCNNDIYYAAITPNPVVVQPTRYPLDFPVCYGWQGLVVAPLRMRIWMASVPDPWRVMWLRKQNLAADGCYTEASDKQPARAPRVEEKDSIYGGAQDYNGWMALDKSGIRDFAASAYRNQLLNAKDLHEAQEKAKEIARNDAINLAKFGHVYVEVTQVDEVVTINGMQWRHRLEATYDTNDPAHASQGRLVEWNESYEHALDDTHILRRQAHYDAMIVADPEWIAARRSLLLKLVQAVRIESMTQAEVDVAVAQYRQQREQDMQEWKRKH